MHGATSTPMPDGSAGASLETAISNNHQPYQLNASVNKKISFATLLKLPWPLTIPGTNGRQKFNKRYNNVNPAHLTTTHLRITSKQIRPT